MSENTKDKIKQANSQALNMLTSAQPTWVDVMPVGKFIPDFKENMILHAGPPIDPANASTPFKNAVGGAAIHEGLAKSLQEAWSMVLSGEIILGSQLDHRGASGAAYAVGASTPVQIAENTFFAAPVLDEEVEGTSLTLPTGLKGETRYFWRVKAITNEAESDYANRYSFVTGEASSVNTLNLDGDLVVYPQPAKNIKYISG